MEELFKKILIAFAVTLLLLLVGVGCWHFGARNGEKIGRQLQYQEDLLAFKPDTLTLVDTVFFDRPLPVIVRHTDTLYIETQSADIHQDDSITVIPIEQKVYQDSLYRAVVSGWHPSLDSITVYQKTKYITATVEVPIKEPQKRNTVFVEGSALSTANTPVVAGYERNWGVLYSGGFAGYDPLQKQVIIGVRGGIRFRW